MRDVERAGDADTCAFSIGKVRLVSVLGSWS